MQIDHKHSSKEKESKQIKLQRVRNAEQRDNAAIPFQIKLIQIKL